ncbi:MAG: zinc-binding dehydrogenase, partial [Acidobacteriaceae bacterium]|nr:zinc-binding dehydrogenase [Acidobacteriaceae bacterium]
LDLVGGDYLGKNLDVLATEGRIAVIATQGGRTAELDLGALMRKRCRVMGSTMRARSSEEKGRVAERLLKRIWPALPTKDPIRPVIDSQFPLTDAAKAHARMESGEHIGKIVLVP